MGLDINFYEGTYDGVTDFETKEKTNIISRNSVEAAHFRKNYCLMEWLERYFNTTIENCEYYIINQKAICNLIDDCNLVIDLVEDYNSNRSEDDEYEFPQEIVEQIVKLFPHNNWNEWDYLQGTWDEEHQRWKREPHKFDWSDYHDICQIREVLAPLRASKYVFCADW